MLTYFFAYWLILCGILDSLTYNSVTVSVVHFQKRGLLRYFRKCLYILGKLVWLSAEGYKYFFVTGMLSQCYNIAIKTCTTWVSLEILMEIWGDCIWCGGLDEMDCDRFSCKVILVEIHWSVYLKRNRLWSYERLSWIFRYPCLHGFASHFSFPFCLTNLPRTLNEITYIQRKWRFRRSFNSNLQSSNLEQMCSETCVHRKLTNFTWKGWRAWASVVLNKQSETIPRVWFGIRKFMYTKTILR